ncbi:hypothetical protein [Neobacillus sp. PS3-40]|uniref:hypothetical protein n=1 Tax=Neobacillus sp. PS3-40 TaxID=3070679 RepID=UPI0027DFFB16|nr:hypothetical protein [Neobacillus sp. PS3-40]WML43727.1 hypothetical protein RCG20_18345 [Neobacillus sp. PS3-40]
MSLKLIEMQIALPRTVDAAKLHEQLSHRGQLSNDHASMQMKQEEIKLRSSVIKQEQKDKANLHHGGQNSEGENKQPEQRTKDSQNEVQQPGDKHPYKGNFLDFSG